MASVRISDLGGFKPIIVRGVTLERGQDYEITVLASLMRCSDENLHFTFDESDKKELMSIDEKLFPVISSELRHEIKSNKDLVDLLIPKKPALKKKTATKSKKSSLTEE